MVESQPQDSVVYFHTELSAVPYIALGGPGGRRPQPARVLYTRGFLPKVPDRNALAATVSR